MALDVIQTRECLRAFDLKRLFVEQLGWDHHTQNLIVSVDGSEYELSSIAEKRGMVVFTCKMDDKNIPDYVIRRKIELKVAKSVHEHLIIFIDRDQGTQIWQWVRRETGKPAACREHSYHYHQPGDALIQKLQSIAFSLEEEEHLALPHVTGGVRAAFDIEHVTKRFYDLFKTEHVAFLEFVKGIPDEDMRHWYVSVMINRLMFIYFIQKKAFLDGNISYLRDKLAASKRGRKDRFYADFLCPMFFEGFARKEGERSATIHQLLGKIPYLNGGIFQRHQLEELHGETISIPDAAFEKLFTFFDQYYWHLDERPLRRDDEINPDVLGYIFEKYVNQKQMGAYYTKEDITGYISQNTVIPRLFDIVRQKCRIAFEGERSVWNLLQEDPDRYIYSAVKKGADLRLPEEITVGVSDVAKRARWNQNAPAEYALPTEIWREVVTRRKRYEEVWTKLLDGEVHDINDLITYNLDIRQFAQDVIETSEGPELLRAFWEALTKITVLDPACGSGAFLFAALNILEPLYEACLNRMQVFLDELEHSKEGYRTVKFSDFRKTLAEAEEHPNLRYFILKSIMLNNIYGVDIMPEAIEICKLRLFLKLVAQVERVGNIEPLPDIDFNIQAGNTLVGFTSREHITRAMTMADNVQMKMVSAEDVETMQRIEEKAEDVNRLFTLFRQHQTEIGGEVTPGDKELLRKRLFTLEDELNGYLASEYGVVTLSTEEKETSLAYQQWLDLYQPFHWFVEFYGIMNDGGFDVIIGNPPYVEYSKVKDDYTVRGFETAECGNLYAYMFERSVGILSVSGWCGLIVPVSAFCTERMAPLQTILKQGLEVLFLSHFSGDRNPAELFTGVKNRLTIALGRKGTTQPTNIRSTRYLKWFTEARSDLFSRLDYVDVSSWGTDTTTPKVGDVLSLQVLSKIHQDETRLVSSLSDQNGPSLYYHNTPIHWTRAFTFAPYFWNERDGVKLSTQLKQLNAPTESIRNAAVAIMNSTLFFWYWLAYSDVYHMVWRELSGFRFDCERLSDGCIAELSELCAVLMKEYANNSIVKRVSYQTTGDVEYQEIDPKNRRSRSTESIECWRTATVSRMRS